MADDCTGPPLTEHFYEPFWNMMQLVAWVYSRDQDVVHRASSKNSDPRTYFPEVAVPGDERRLAERPGRPVSLIHLLLSRLLREGKEAPNLDLDIAERAVIRALCEGRLSATGIPAGGSYPEKIEAEAWAYLELFESDRHEVCARLSDGPQKYELRYSAMKVKRDEVLNIWPCWTEIETQQRASRQAAGRYQLREAAEEIAEHSGERADELIKKLEQAVRAGTLPVYEPDKNQRHTSETVRDFYDEVYAEDLNTWLDRHEARIAWRFPVSMAGQPAHESASEAESRPGSKPLSRQRWQEQEILRVLKEGNYDPLSLPKSARGKPGVRKWTRDRLPAFSESVHKLAWERMLKAGDLRFADLTLETKPSK